MTSKKLNIGDFLTLTGNIYGNIAAKEVCGDITDWIDTGSYSLNALLSGSIYKGLPGNKVVGFVGDPGVGKTFFALASAKYFLKSDPEAQVFYFETESALTKDILIERDIDLERFALLPVVTVQEFRYQVLQIVEQILKQSKKDRNNIFIILDSLGNLSTQKEVEDATAGVEKKDMTRAQLIKSVFRMLTLKLGIGNIPLILTNHVYSDMSGSLYVSKQQSGGSGPKYACSIVINLTKSKAKDSQKNHFGSIITCTAQKSRITKEGAVIKCLIRFDGGLDRYYGLLELAERSGVFVKKGKKYELPDGRSFSGPHIERNPENIFTKEVLDEIDKYTQTHFKYGIKDNLDDNSFSKLSDEKDDDDLFNTDLKE